MTRFARAKGSKASNERVPETATPWDVMKNDLKQSQNEAKNKKSREKMNELRQKTYDEFLDEEDKKTGKKWAEFPVSKKTPMKAKQKLNKKKKNLVSEHDVTDEMIEEFDKSDDEIDPKVENFKKDIEKVLKKNKNKKKEEDDDDDAPEEKTSKVPAKEVNNKKAKKQQQKQGKQEKRKMPKEKDDGEHKRRKPDLEEHMTVMVNGETQRIARYDGFPVLQTDFVRLKELRKSLMKKGVPQSEVKRTMQCERRKAEKYLSRLKKHVCFNCRKTGHVLSECPDLTSKTSLIENTGTGICFKCGSAEHKLSECKTKDGQGLKFASCFICREQGHIARECPDNPRGLYPQGGACRLCGDVTHLKKDCPQTLQEKSDKDISLTTISNGDIEALDADDSAKKTKKQRKTPAKKVVKF